MHIHHTTRARHIRTRRVVAWHVRARPARHTLKMYTRSCDTWSYDTQRTTHDAFRPLLEVVGRRADASTWLAVRGQARKLGPLNTAPFAFQAGCSLAATAARHKAPDGKHTSTPTYTHAHVRAHTYTRTRAPTFCLYTHDADSMRAHFVQFQIQGETLPCLRQTGEGFLLEFV